MITFVPGGELDGGSLDEGLSVVTYNLSTDVLAPVADPESLFGRTDTAMLFPSISADGSQLAFLAATDEPTLGPEFFVHNFDAGTTRQVSHFGLNAPLSFDPPTLIPLLSGDASTIAFSSSADLIGLNPDNGMDLFTLDVTTGAVTQRTRFGADAELAVISIDHSGGRVAFTSESDLIDQSPDGNAEVFLYDRTLDAVFQLTDSRVGNNSFGSVYPILSADGDHLTYHAGDLHFFGGIGVTLLELTEAGPEGIGTIIDDDQSAGPLGSISGFVFADVNNNGVKDPQELGLPNVPIHLSGRLQTVAWTDAQGRYQFDDLPPGVYTVEETQPLAFVDGIDSRGTPPLGQVEDDRFVKIDLPPGATLTDYSFGERGLCAEMVNKRLLLASTPPAERVIATLQLGIGTNVFAFKAGDDAVLTTTVAGAPGGNRIELYSGNMLPVALGEVDRLSTSVTAGEDYVLHVLGSSESAELQVRLDPKSPMAKYGTNRHNPLDVNNSGSVSPVDALLVIYALNQPESRAASEYDLDVSQDGCLSPIDALLVIDFLNRKEHAEGEFAARSSATQGSGEARMASYLLPGPVPAGDPVQTPRSVWQHNAAQPGVQPPPCCRVEAGGQEENREARQTACARSFCMSTIEDGSELEDLLKVMSDERQRQWQSPLVSDAAIAELFGL